MANFILALVNAELSLFGVATRPSRSPNPPRRTREPRRASTASTTAAPWAEGAPDRNGAGIGRFHARTSLYARARDSYHLHGIGDRRAVGGGPGPPDMPACGRHGKQGKGIA